MEQLTVMVADDDKEIRDGISIYLRNEGFRTIGASNGQEALELLEKQQVHLVIMDVMMPQLDGIHATFKIREQRNIPIIMLSARSEDSDKIHGLSIGADDYVTKPFHPMELMARVKSQLRRYVMLGDYGQAGNNMEIDGLILDSQAKTVSLDGVEIRMTPTEFNITELLMKHAGWGFI